MNLKRGLFIVLEGCDRCGKSTQSQLLTNYLTNFGIKVQQLHFPARDSEIGKMIDAYLRNKQELSDQAIHLLFSANRWESVKTMRKLLESGVTLVVDRYSYSGVAYSVAKGLPFEWCMAPEKGLIRPDIVFYLKATTEGLTTRGGFGEERYEKLEFQRKVGEVFDRICQSEKHYWREVNAVATQDGIHKEISETTLKYLKEFNDKPLELLQ